MKQNILSIASRPKIVIGIAAAAAVVIAGVLYFFIGQAPEYLYSSAKVGSISTDVTAVGVVAAASPVPVLVPIGGRVASVTAVAGTNASAGTALARIDGDDSQGAVSVASAALQAARANYTRLSSGATSADLNVSLTAVATAKANLAETERQQDTLVTNAYRSYLSNDLEAVAYSDRGEAMPQSVTGSVPVVSGSYNGTVEGEYRLKLYASGAPSGYSFDATGLESSGPSLVDSKTAVPVGTRGLYVTFPTDFQRGVDWVISVPNKRSSTYSSSLNAYESAKRTRDQAVTAAQSALAQAQAALALKQSAARPEDLSAASAQLQSAENAYRNAQDTHPTYDIAMPVEGTIQSVSLVAGGVAVSEAQAAVIVPKASFEIDLAVRPEDAARASLGQQATTTIGDASYVGTVASIALAKDGSYMVRVMLADAAGIESGASGSVTLIGTSAATTLVVPRAAVFSDNGSSYVLVKAGSTVSERTVAVGLMNADSAEIVSGLQEGEQVVTFSK